MKITRSQCKSITSEFPVGDPFSGPSTKFSVVKSATYQDPVTAMYIATAVAATSTLASAQQQSVQMGLQAQQAELQGRQGALSYNKQANAILERQNQLAATIRARAVAGGVNPDTGSALTLQEVNAEKAGQEFDLAKSNAEVTLYGGLAQSQSLQAAADDAMTFGYLNAGSQAGMGYYRGSRVATPGATR